MSGWLALALSIIVITITAVALNRRIQSRTSQQAALDEIKREVGSIITELNQTTERNIEIAEDRIGKLRDLIEEADRRVKTLKRDIAGHQQAGVIYDARGTARRDRIEDPPQKGPLPARESTNTTEDAAPRATESRQPAAASRSEVRDEVRMLYLQGLPIERIAVRVGVTVGEVELILSLQQGAE